MTDWPTTTGVLRYYGLMDTYDDFGNPDALRRGRLVTAAAHLLAGRKEVGAAWERRHEECAGYLAAYRKFMSEHRVSLLESEPEYRCTVHRYVSHPDQIVGLDGSLGNLELKTGALPKWIKLQTAGQVIAIGKPGMRRFGLLLKNDGTYRLEEHTDYRDLDKFRAMVETWWTLHELLPSAE